LRQALRLQNKGLSAGVQMKIQFLRFLLGALALGAFSSLWFESATWAITANVGLSPTAVTAPMAQVIYWADYDAAYNTTHPTITFGE